MTHSNKTFSEFRLPEPEHLFLSTAQNSYTYRSLFQFQSGLKKYLERRDYRSGDQILVVAELNAPLVFCIAACWNLNIPFVPLSLHDFNQLTEASLHNLNANHLITDTSIDNPVVTVIPLSEQFIEQRMREAEVDPVEIESDKTTNNSELLGTFHSSGTTGIPKCIPLKRRQMLHGARYASHYLQPGPNSCWLLCLPPYHIGGTAVILRSILYGCSIHLMSRFNVDEAIGLLSSQSRIQVVSLVPTMLKRLLDRDYFEPHPSFKGILLGGGPIDATLIEDAIQRNIPIITSYGMTETCAQITANTISPHHTNPNIRSVGQVFQDHGVQIRDQKGAVLEPNETGLIWLKGPQIFDGYDSEALNKKHFDQHGWFNTGDYGQLDEKGNLYIEMRRTDQIVSGGKNINPHEIEAILQRWTRIQDIAIVGQTDPEWGEIVTAMIVPETDRNPPTLEEVKSYLQESIESYKLPKKIIYKTRLPRTSVGKINRSALKEEANNTGSST